MSTARGSLRLSRKLAAHPSHVLNEGIRWSAICSNWKRWISQPAPRSRPKRQARISRKDDTDVRARASRNDQERVERAQERAVLSGQEQPAEATEQQQQPGRNTQLATTLAQSNSSDLIAEVRIPHDKDGILPTDHPALSILGNSSLVIQRQMEMMNILMGFEQANRYIIMDGQGQTIGYIAEQDHGIGSAFARQMFRTHRSFTTHIFDSQQREVLRIHRPFAYINSRIRIYDCVPEGGYAQTETSTALQGTSTSSVVNPETAAQVSPLKLDEMRIIGEAQQVWAPLRRKYDLFTSRPLKAPRNDEMLRIQSGEQPELETKALTEAKAPEKAIEAGMLQFAHVNEPFLSWDFTLRSEDQSTIGSVNRNFGGFAREIFTDTGVYALRMDSAAQSSSLETVDGRQVEQYDRDPTAMTLDQRAVMLAAAVSIDFDYFSRHSTAGGGMGFMPIWFPGMGGGAAEAGAAGAGVGAVEGAGAAGAATRGIGAAGASEGAIAGAGTMAGYEAMQRGAYGSPSGDDASPTNAEPLPGAEGQTSEWWDKPGEGDVWGQGSDPWGGGGGPDGAPPSSGGGGEGGSEGGGWLDSISDFFGE